jgi:adenylate cyclase
MPGVARAQRKLTVLASLDVAGYTRHMERDERGTLLALARIRMRIIRPTLAEHGGSMFKTMGDGALIEFPNVEDSVRWAIAFQTAMAERNASRTVDAIEVRLGIGLADVFVSGEDRFGAAVGFVVRLQQAAPAGGIAITHSVRWQLAKPLVHEFDRTEWVEFKNMDEQFEIWLWRGPNANAKSTPQGVVGFGHRPLGATSTTTRTLPSVEAPPLAPAMQPAATSRPSIAVLAFDNMSGDPSAESIADGVVEEITATLSRVRDFTVVARNSAYAYKGRHADVREIARTLGVRYVLEGSLRKSHDRVRVTAQLVDADSGAHLWADSYDGMVDNLFDFEDEIAEQVAGAVYPSIQQAEIAIAKRKRPESLAAYDLVLRALPHLWAHRREENAQAIVLLDEARRLDPGYARAIAVAAWARAQHIIYSWTDDAERLRVEAHALIEEAAALVGDDPTALAALATATTLLLADLDRAEHFADRALKLDPNNAWAWSRRGFIEAYRGNAEPAIEAFQHAIRLSPLDPFSFNSLIGMGFANFVLGRYDEAIEWTLRGMREKAGMTWAHRDLAAYYGLSGRIGEAKASVAILLETREGLTITRVGEALRFIEASVLARYLSGLKLAGLHP